VVAHTPAQAALVRAGAVTSSDTSGHVRPNTLRNGRRCFLMAGCPARLRARKLTGSGAAPPVPDVACCAAPWPASSMSTHRRQPTGAHSSCD